MNKQKGSPRFAGEAGLAPILIVLLIALAVGGYLIYQKQIKPVAVPQQVAQSTSAPSSNPESTTSAASPAPNGAGETANPVSIGANWKTYTKLGYEIKYPQFSVITEYNLDPSVPDLLSSTNTEIKVDNQASILFLVSIWNNLGVNITDTLSRDKWCSLLQKELIGQLECNFEGKLPLVQVNGYYAYQTTGGRDSNLVKRIYIPHDKYVYELEFPIEDSLGKRILISDKILSTFKFL